LQNIPNKVVHFNVFTLNISVSDPQKLTC